MRTLFYIVIIQNETAYSIIRRSEDFVNGFKNTEISGYGIFLFLSDRIQAVARLTDIRTKLFLDTHNPLNQ